MNRKLMMSLITALMVATSVAPVVAQEHNSIANEKKETAEYSVSDVWPIVEKHLKNNERFKGYDIQKSDFKLRKKGNFLILEDTLVRQRLTKGEGVETASDYVEKKYGITGNESVILTKDGLMQSNTGQEGRLNYRYIDGRYVWDYGLINDDWNVGGPIAYEIIIPLVKVEHKTLDGALLMEEEILVDDALLGVFSCAMLEFHGGRVPLEVEGLEYHRFNSGVITDAEGNVLEKKEPYVAFFDDSDKRLIKNFESKEFQGLKPLYDKVEIDVMSKPNVVFYYSNEKTVTPTIVENKGEADLVIKNVDAGGVELSSRGLNLMPGEYDVEPEVIDEYKATSDPVKVVLKEGDKETIIFIYDKASSPIVPIVAVSAPLLILLFVTTRKGVIVYKIEEDGTRTKIASKQLKTRVGGNVLDISKELKLANTDNLEIEFLKHTTRKVAGKEITIKGVIDGKEINITDTIPVQLNKEYTVRL